jgi:hypothetical protein
MNKNSLENTDSQYLVIVYTVKFGTNSVVESCFQLRTAYIVTSLLLPNAVNVQTVTICLYLQNNIRVLFVSCNDPPDSLILHSGLDSVFSSFDFVFLVGV